MQMYVITWPLLIGPELNALAPHCVELARRSVVLVYLGREGGAVNVDENTMTEGAYISVCFYDVALPPSMACRCREKLHSARAGGV